MSVKNKTIKTYLSECRRIVCINMSNASKVYILSLSKVKINVLCISITFWENKRMREFPSRSRYQCFLSRFKLHCVYLIYKYLNSKFKLNNEIMKLCYGQTNKTNILTDISHRHQRSSKVTRSHLSVLFLSQWIVPQFLNLRPKMAKSIVYVITLITNRNHAFHCLN